ncbi:hypothetical protein L3X38_034920 [Prunus dulcis]|uniref:Uncharacterized protein n=1 Tax=Prunus dulcis TaxID=3755 RepID=A0AAD4VKZ3_PRUDU|nr:hypothetical protein L3X38_034920 [Prunus dulcis]
MCHNLKHYTLTLGTDFKHLLDLLQKFYFLTAVSVPSVVLNNITEEQTSSCPSEPDYISSNKWGFKYCTSELLEAAIEFQIPAWDDNKLLNINFDNGVLSIPQLIITDASSSVLRNLIAFEQYGVSSTNGVTSYAFLLQSLISNTSDFKLLLDKEIIAHNRFSDPEFLSEFETIVKDVVPKDDFYFAKLRDQVDKHKTPVTILTSLKYFLWCNFKVKL